MAGDDLRRMAVALYRIADAVDGCYEADDVGMAREVQSKAVTGVADLLETLAATCKVELSRRRNEWISDLLIRLPNAG